jgi:hypothetical protein
MIGQREKIYAILCLEDYYHNTTQVVTSCHASGDESVIKISARPANRCLNELLSMGKVQCKHMGTDNMGRPLPYWKAIK